MRTERVLRAGVPALVALTALIGGDVHGQEEGIRLAFTGRSFGSFASLGQVVLAPETAPAFISCDPGSQVNDVASAEVAPLFSVGTVVNTAEGIDGNDLKSATTTDTVEEVSLLGGLVTAEAVSATSETTFDGFAFSAGGETSLVDLRILGIPLGFTPPPNTTVPLAGFGHLVLNEQTSGTSASLGFARVNAIHLVITVPNPLVDVGTEIIIGSARSQLQTAPVFLRGFGFGAAVTVGGVSLAGPFPLEGLPCWGTGGAVRENTVSELELPGILTSGTLRATTQGDFTPSPWAETVSEIEDLDLLGGLVTADLLRAKTQLSSDANGDPAFTAQGTKFENLAVAGFPEIDDSVPFNTRVALPGLGNLWLKFVIREPNRLRLWMVYLEVLQANPLGLPVGARVQLGATSVGID